MFKTTPPTPPGGYTGIGVTGDVLIYGNLLVTGSIDPTYLVLTPQASGPVGFTNPLWVDNNGYLRSENIKLENATDALTLSASSIGRTGATTFPITAVDAIDITSTAGTITLNAPANDINLNAATGIFLTSTGGNINLDTPFGTATFTNQITLPNTTAAASFAAPTLTCDFNSFSTGVFSVTLIANMTTIAFTNGRIGGQYVIYVTAIGSTYTIASALSGTANRTNYTSAVSVTINTSALLTVTYDGTRYIIACSAYN